MSEFVYRPSLSLTPSQEKIDQSTARFKVVKAGRQFGKTKYGISWLIKQALSRTGLDHWYMAPTYRMAKEIAWDELMRQLPEELMVRVNERELYIELPMKSKIWLKGSDKEHMLRGRAIGSIVPDEAAFQKGRIYSEVIRPMLAAHQAPVLFISSPKKGWFTKLFNEAAAGTLPDHEAFHFTIYDNPYISKEEIEKIKATTSDDVWRQEYLAEEVEGKGQVYSEFMDSSVFDPARLYQGHTSYSGVVGIDWGKYDDTGVVWLHAHPEGQLILSREHVRYGWDTKRHSDIIRAASSGRNVKPVDYVIDRSTFSVHEGGLSIAQQFAKHLGHTLQRSEKDLGSGIDLMKRFMRGDGQKPWLLVSSSCTETLRAIDTYEYGDHEPDILAALRYSLVHAVKRRITKLAESVPIMKYENIDPPADEMARLTGLLAPKLKKERFGWDYEDGVPMGGPWQS